jgi:flagellar L-ring protein precursor FlgH
VRVTGLTPNGDLTVQGEQELLLNGERQLIVLSGVVRPRDIAENNTVSSSRLADARIEFDGEGFIADKSKPGWIARFFAAIGL